MNLNWKPNSFLERLNQTLLYKLTESLDILDTSIKQECPVITGKLKGSIEKSMDTSVTNKPKCIIVTKAFYAWWVEMGTVKSAPNAFMRRGLAASISSIQGIFKSK